MIGAAPIPCTNGKPTDQRKDDDMFTTDEIIGVGREKKFAPVDYRNVARGNKALAILEHRKLIKEADEVITYFEGFARGMEEAAENAGNTKH